MFYMQYDIELILISRYAMCLKYLCEIEHRKILYRVFRQSVFLLSNREAIYT